MIFQFLIAAGLRPQPRAGRPNRWTRSDFNQRTRDALDKSIGFFQQAIARDPGYALGYSGLADTYAMLGFRGGLPSQDALSRAKLLIDKHVVLFWAKRRVWQRG